MARVQAGGVSWRSHWRKGHLQRQPGPPFVTERRSSCFTRQSPGDQGKSACMGAAQRGLLRFASRKRTAAILQRMDQSRGGTRKGADAAVSEKTQEVCPRRVARRLGEAPVQVEDSRTW